MKLYNLCTDEMEDVPDVEMPHVAFCDLARRAFALLRSALALPEVSPVFVWECDYGFAQPLGATVMVDGEMVTLIHQNTAHITPESITEDITRMVGRIVTASKGLPRAYGRLPVPQGIYYSVLLTAKDDTFALRVLHAHDYRDGWITRLDLVHSGAEPKVKKAKEAGGE